MPPSFCGQTVCLLLSGFTMWLVIYFWNIQKIGFDTIVKTNYYKLHEISSKGRDLTPHRSINITSYGNVARK